MFGSVCWYCYWGWPKKIWEIYQRAERDIDDMLAPSPENNWTSPEQSVSGEYALEFGPAHCTWSDENFNGDHEWELENCNHPSFADWPPEVLERVRQSLRELAALPAELKSPPKGYNGQDPAKFSPPPEWKVQYWGEKGSKK